MIELFSLYVHGVCEWIDEWVSKYSIMRFLRWDFVAIILISLSYSCFRLWNYISYDKGVLEDVNRKHSVALESVS